MVLSLVIINNLYSGCVTRFPNKANAPLIVDSDAVLPSPITLQQLQPISRWHPQKIQSYRSIKLRQLTKRNRLNVNETGNASLVKNRLGIGTGKTQNHAQTITEHVNNVKR